MFASLLLSLASLTAATGGPGSLNLGGRCEYSPQIQAYRDQAVLALCDSLSIERGTNQATISFNQRSWGRQMQFGGSMSGNRVTVRELTLPSGKKMSAEGSCEIFHANDRISVVSCLALAKGMTYAGNFRPSPLE